MARGATKLKRDETLERRRQVSEMRKNGATQPQMALALHVSQPTISNDMKFVLKEWQSERIENTEQLITRELLKIDQSEIEARSIFNDEVRRAKGALENPIYDPSGKIIGYQGREPSYKWWDRVQAMRCERRKLLGLDGPAKVEHTVRVEDLRRQIEQEATRLGIEAETDDIMVTAIQLANGN